MAQSNDSHNYAFDVKLYAVVRVQAKSEAEGRRAARQAVDGATVELAPKDGDTAAQITEVNLYVDDVTGPYLIEIDGEDVD